MSYFETIFRQKHFYTKKKTKHTWFGSDRQEVEFNLSLN